MTWVMAWSHDTGQALAMNHEDTLSFDDLLELRVSELIDAWPATLKVLVDAGFTPLAHAPIRATLAPTVTLRQAMRIRSLDALAQAQLMCSLQQVVPCRS